ncbi:MAG: hypothetical protein CM15mV24_1310 [Bellamyvirus sp.]|nr:MAG: hypothetical protein CM15mV24_1310 [Bellamyvirus sp.]
MKILLERFPYRYVECGTLEINGMPDYRIQKAHEYTKRYSDMYLLDNQMQLLTAMDDFEYTKWLILRVFLLYKRHGNTSLNVEQDAIIAFTHPWMTI